ncbi:MAG: HD-GYP domain-containing protein [Methylococcaceae bacterium]|nr:MAG: HD-GYP domain-containing protein [Methylococcaceae bacterium]
MIKKIKVQFLRTGMYVHDLNCDWMEHPFANNRFLVGEHDIGRLNEWGIREVYIDTARGLDVDESAAALTAEEVQQAINTRMQSIAAQPGPAAKVALREELERAEIICQEANCVIQSLFLNARLGKQVELEQVQPLVTTMAASILRNPDAMLGLARIKRSDTYTFQHSVSVCALLIAFCQALHLDSALVETVGVGGLLHDIGKMKISSSVLNKPGKLDDHEFALIKEHVVYGKRMLENMAGISPVSIKVAAQHHERYDGLGYPHGLQGDDISLYGHMAAIADVYDALTSERIYHHGEAPTAVLHKLLEWSEDHFHPELVQHFIRVVGIYPVGTLVRLESGRLAVVMEQHHGDLLHPRVKIIYSTRSKAFLPPQEIDLSLAGAGDRIVAFEPCEKWKIDPQRYA